MIRSQFATAQPNKVSGSRGIWVPALVNNLNIQEDRQCTLKGTFRRVRVTIVAVDKQKSITYSEFVFVALVIQHAMRMGCIAICSLQGCTIFFYTIS